MGVDYATVYQGASETLTGEDKAASGIFRVFTNWALLNRDGPNTGSLVLKVENRHKIGTEVPPSGLANEIGYLGVTGVFVRPHALFMPDFSRVYFCISCRPS